MGFGGMESWTFTYFRLLFSWWPVIGGKKFASVVAISHHLLWRLHVFSVQLWVATARYHHNCWYWCPLVSLLGSENSANCCNQCDLGIKEQECPCCLTALSRASKEKSHRCNANRTSNCSRVPVSISCSSTLADHKAKALTFSKVTRPSLISGAETGVGAGRSDKAINKMSPHRSINAQVARKAKG